MTKKPLKLDKELKLIYVHEVGINSKNEGIYEFIFSVDETAVNIDGWFWNKTPASNYAEVPTENMINKTITLTTDKFKLICLHKSDTRPYEDGYYNIIALAYEDYRGEFDSFDYEDIFEDEEEDGVAPLVFHYGMSFELIKEKLYEREIVLNEDKFIDSSKVKID